MELRRFRFDVMKCRNERSKLLDEVDTLHKEKEGFVSDSIEMKSKIEELKGLLSEESRQKETKEKELQEKGQLLYDVEEERVGSKREGNDQ